MATIYFTASGPKHGPFLWRDAWGVAVGVLGARDGRIPIGVATPVGCGAGGVATWRLIVRGQDVDGLWIVVGREFWRHDPHPR
jgi:hypothetical protein